MAERVKLIEKFLAGVEIIRQYDEEADLVVGHELVLFGSYSTREKMSADERLKLLDLGWYEYEEAWALNVW